MNLKFHYKPFQKVKDKEDRKGQNLSLGYFQVTYYIGFFKESKK